MKTFEQFMEHHRKDATGKVIEHGDGTPSSVEEDYYRGTGEKVVARTKKWMDKKGQKGAPGLDAMKARTAEHKAKRGVKEEVVDEAKVEKGYISNLAKAQARNERRFGTKGSTTPQGYFGQKPSQAAELSAKRTAEHKARRGVKSEGYQRDPDRQEKERKTSKQTDPSKAGFTGISNDIGEIMRQNAAMKKAAAKKKGVSEAIREPDSSQTLQLSLDQKKRYHKARGEMVLKKELEKDAKSLSKEEVVTELNRYGKETGKATGSINKRAGTPVKKGGSTDDKALTFVRKMIRKETGKPEGQRKKIKGEKGRVQYGDRKFSPADSIAKRRASKAAADAAMRDTRGT